MQVSIANYLDLERTNRIDAEFFWPDFIFLSNLLAKRKTQSLTDLCHVSDGNHMSVADHFQTTGDIPYFRGQDINKDFFIENANPVYISDSVYNFPYMKRSLFQAGDILLSIVGTIGSLSFVTDKIKKSTGSCKIAILRTKGMKGKYIAAFLKSKYGQFQIKRNTRGAVQQGLLLEDMDQIRVYIPSNVFEGKISASIDESILLNRLSKETYDAAQIILLSELGLASWQHGHRLTFIKNYSDTEHAGRIDADYYQPKYEEVIKTIQGYADGWDTLESLVTIKDRNFTPEHGKQYQYIELANVFGSGEITDCIIERGQYLPTRARRMVVSGEVIASSIEGSLSSVALIEKQHNRALCSTGFYVLNPKFFNSETLMVLLKSLVGQLQLKKGCSGTILTAINSDELRKIQLPKINKKKQFMIQEKVIKSFKLRRQSKNLLKYAKKAVEMAIEKGENKATKWLEKQTEESTNDI